MKKLSRILATGLIVILLSSCARREKEEKAEEVPLEVPYKEYDVEEEERIEEPSPVNSAIIDDIGIVDELTPETFVKLTILYRKENKKWLEYSKSLPAEEQAAYIDLANREFFSAFGITEEEYISYSQQHIDELNAYMNEHPELLPQVMEE